MLGKNYNGIQRYLKERKKKRHTAPLFLYRESLTHFTKNCDFGERRLTNIASNAFPGRNILP